MNKIESTDTATSSAGAKDQEAVAEAVSGGTPYDDAFRTMTNDCAELLIFVVNEIFKTKYSAGARVVFGQNEHFINTMDGGSEKDYPGNGKGCFGTVGTQLQTCEGRSREDYGRKGNRFGSEKDI